jgi:hypothetical protein
MSAVVVIVTAFALTTTFYLAPTSTYRFPA